MENLSKAIKLLAQQISLDSLSTKDLILELTNLFAKVEKLEQELEKEQYRYKKDCEAHSNTREELAKYMAEFIVPKKEYEAREIKLERAIFEHNAKIEFINREVLIYQQFVSSLTSSSRVLKNSNTTNGNSYSSESNAIDKPSFPNSNTLSGVDKK